MHRRGLWEERDVDPLRPRTRRRAAHLHRPEPRTAQRRTPPRQLQGRPAPRQRSTRRRTSGSPRVRAIEVGEIAHTLDWEVVGRAICEVRVEVLPELVCRRGESEAGQFDRHRDDLGALCPHRLHRGLPQRLFIVGRIDGLDDADRLARQRPRSPASQRSRRPDTRRSRPWRISFIDPGDGGSADGDVGHVTPHNSGRVGEVVIGTMPVRLTGPGGGPAADERHPLRGSDDRAARVELGDRGGEMGDGV